MELIDFKIADVVYTWFRTRHKVEKQGSNPYRSFQVNT